MNKLILILGGWSEKIQTRKQVKMQAKINHKQKDKEKNVWGNI